MAAFGKTAAYDGIVTMAYKYKPAIRQSSAKRYKILQDRYLRQECLKSGGITMDALKLISDASLKSEVPAFEVGDTVRVQVRIKEGEKYRLQAFEGTVIAKRHGGIQETFTVRRVAHGCGIERVFPVHSPSVDKIEVVRSGAVRRAKLYYLKNRVGKAAKSKTKF